MGILFGGDTASANNLDDYEEGTYSFTGTAVGTVSGGGNYVKIGRVVHINGLATNFSDSSSGSGITLQGLPFTAKDGTFRIYAELSRFSQRSGCSGVSCDTHGNSNDFAVGCSSNSSTTPLALRYQDAHHSSAMSISWSGTYTTDS